MLWCDNMKTAFPSYSGPTWAKVQSRDAWIRREETQSVLGTLRDSRGPSVLYEAGASTGQITFKETRIELDLRRGYGKPSITPAGQKFGFICI